MQYTAFRMRNKPTETKSTMCRTTAYQLHQPCHLHQHFRELGIRICCKRVRTLCDVYITQDVLYPINVKLLEYFKVYTSVDAARQQLARDFQPVKDYRTICFADGADEQTILTYDCFKRICIKSGSRFGASTYLKVIITEAFFATQP